MTVFSACSDDDSEAEFLFDREISELSVLRECAKDADSGAYCFMVRFRYPIDVDGFKKIYLWVDSNVVGDTAKTVNDEKLEKATDVFNYSSKTEATFDTIDLTKYIKDYVEVRDSLLVAIYCHYSSGRPGTVQRVYLHFGDDIAPSELNLSDSSWTTGFHIRWSRPPDQTDYYKPNELSGPIAGYNFIIRTLSKDEDLRKLKVRLESADGVDSTGDKLYKRHKRFSSDNDSVWMESVAHEGDAKKRELRIAIPDGRGFNVENPDSNDFRLVIDGLKSEREYLIGYASYDSCGNFSGTQDDTLMAWRSIKTTDSVAPLMPTKIFTLKDSLFPEMARLDSNNRLRIFWSRSVDPYEKKNEIQVDSVLTIPSNCISGLCFDYVQRYKIEYWDASAKQWVVYRDADTLDLYSKLYKISADTMKVSSSGTFVTDTIRWVSPGDTLILRIRSIDDSKYYSVALIDTIYVSPGALAKEIECPEGFVAVQASDTNIFCMERFEHRNDSGKFMTNVLHSEALATCEAISAEGLTVSLCNERDWELVCLSDGSLAYGVIQEDVAGMEDFLFSDCNVATNNPEWAENITMRNRRCVNLAGVHDMPGQFQEWVRGRSEDTVAVVKGGSYLVMGGIDRETQALCTNRSFPYYTRLAYTKDSVYLYREGTKVDTVFEADTSRTLYKVLTKKDFKDSLQFFDVQDSNGNSVGTDYAPYSEYKKGGEAWLEKLGNGMKYVPDHIEVVFLTGGRVSYRGAANYYKSPIIGFRCCAYKNEE